MEASSSIDFSYSSLVNYLWPQFVEKLGIDRAQKAVCQALDLQKMYGNQNTLPVLFAETCGLALANIDLISNQMGLSCKGKGKVLIFSIKENSLQLLQEN